MASDSGNIAPILALLIALVLGYLLALITSPVMRRARPRRRGPRARSRTRPDLRRATTSQPAARCASASGTTRSCVLRLDASGLTADGRRIDIPGAIARCKVSGQVELTFASDGSRQVYLALKRSLAGAGVVVTITRPGKE